MYIVNIYTHDAPWQSIILTFTSQTEILDFISLLHLSQNSAIAIKIRYERREDTRYDETESHGRV